jgi:hypothetical protein
MISIKQIFYLRRENKLFVEAEAAGADLESKEQRCFHAAVQDVGPEEQLPVE